MGSKTKRTLFFLSAGILVLVAVSAFFLLKGDEDTAALLEPGTVLRVGIECAFAPYNWEENKASDTNLPLFTDKGFYVDGYDVQILKRVAQSLSADVEVHKIAWEDLLPELNEGKIDMVFSGMVDTEARRQIVAFSDIYNAHPASYSIMTRKDSRYSEGSTLADFYNARMVGQKDTILDTVIDQIYGVKHLPPIETVPQMFEYLEMGKADGVVINTESAHSYLKEYPNMAIIQFARGEGFEPPFRGLCAAIRKDNKKLLKAVNKALDRISTETRLQLFDQMTAKAEKADKVM